MEMTIKSRRLGRTLHFCTAYPDRGYIYLGSSYVNGQQICQGGGFTGNTLSAHSEESFRRQVKNWYRSYLKDQIEYYGA